MVNAATEFVKAGYSEEDAATLGYIASMYSNVADEEVAVGEAANFMIAQMAAFNIEAEDSMHIIDAVNEVANAFAVSSADISDSLGIMSAAMASGNVEFEQAIGLLTAGTEITRSANKTARGLVSIQSRLNQVVDESSTVGQALTNWYNEHNIAIYDQEGQLKSLFDILADVSEIWPTLTRNEQAYYLNQQAGANQTQNLSAILQNFSTAVEATATAYSSAGSAAEENARYMESLSAKLTAVQSSFQELANSVINSELVSTLLDLVNGFLELLNSGIGPFIVQFGLLTGALTGGITLLGQFGKSLSSTVQGFGLFVKALTSAKGFVSTYTAATTASAAATTAAGAAAGSAATGFAALSAAALPIAAIIAGIVVAFQGISWIVDQVTVSFEEQQEKVAELKTELQNYKTEYEQLVSQRDTENGLTQAEEYRLSLLEKQLAIKEAQLKLEQDQAFEMAVDTSVGGSTFNLGLAEQQRYKALADGLEYYQEKLAELGPITEENSKQAENYIEEIEDLQSAMLDSLSVWSDAIVALQEWEELGYDLPPAVAEMIDAYEKATEGAGDYGIAIEGVTNASEDAEAKFDELSVSAQAAEIAIGNLESNIGVATDNLDSYQQAISAIKTAVDEFNTSNSISVDTFQSLLDVQPEVLVQLVNQQGQLELNDETIANLNATEKQFIESLIQEKIVSYAAQVGEEYLQKQNEDLSDVIENESRPAFQGLITDSAELATSVFAAGEAYRHAAAAMKATKAVELAEDPTKIDWQRYYEEALGLTEDFAKEAAGKVQTYSDALIGIANSVVGSLESGTYATEGATSANNSYNSSLKETNDLLKERQNLLDEELSILEHQIFLMEKNGASAQDIIAVYEQAQQKVYEAANYYREQGLEETSEYIRDAQQLWWGYEDDIKDVMQSIADAQKEAFDEARAYQEHLLNMNIITEEQYYSQLDEDMRNYWSLGVISAEEYWDYLEDKYDWQMSQLEEAADAMKQAYDDLVADTEDKLNAVMDYVSDYADEQIDALQSQYDALQDEIDAVNDKYDEQLDALKEENDELNKQIERERLLEALAKARSQRLYVYKEGEGFQYMEDIDAIAEAQEALDEFDREQAYEDMLEEQEAFIEQNRQNELKYLEDEQAALEAEIERWEQYKEGWADIVDNYQKNQNALIAQQVLGTNLENANWDTRLNLLDNFVGMYTEFQDTLLATQENTTQYEAWNWEERLANLRNFYQQYVDLLQQIQDASEALQPGDVSPGGDYWYGDIDADYSELMLQAKSLEEFQYWAQQRLLKAQAAGYDIEAMGWRTNEELYNEWLASMGGYAPSNPNWSPPTTGNEDYYPLYGSQEKPNVSSDTSWDADTDYALKMLAAATKEEFDYWAAKRIAKANAMGIDIFTGKVWQTNEELYRQWLQTHGSSAAYSRSGVSVLSSSGYDNSQSAARNLVSTSGYSGGSNSTSYSFSIDNLSLPNATDANSLVSGLRNMAYQYSAQRA